MDSYKKDFRNLVNHNLLLIFSLPIIFNSLLNFFQKFDLTFIDKISFTKLGSFILGTVFFLYLSDFLNKQFLFGGRSIALVFYLTSYFIFDSVLLFIGKKIDFQSTFILISLFWCGLILYKTNNYIGIFKIISFLSIYKLFNKFFINDLINNSTYKELNTDVPAQWLDIASMIYENNYFFALENNLIEGQGLLPSYIQALLFEIGFSYEKFQFIQINSYLLLSFSILLITDLKISKKNKIFSSVLFVSVVTNNDWLEYLLINSLMIEGIVSFFISVYIFNFFQMYKMKNSTSFLFFLSFGGMVLTKNFVSLISLMVIVVSIFFLRENIFLVLSFVIYSLNLFYQKIYFSELQNFAYTSEIDFKDLIFDFIYLRDLDFTKASDILNQFFIDKPTTYIVVVFLIINLFTFRKFGINFNTNELMFIFVILNYILVNLLYVSVWRNMEFESSYRYIISCFHMIFVSLVINLSKFEETSKF